MRALLLALCLVWATLHSSLRLPAPTPGPDDPAPTIASRFEQAVLTGTQPLRIRLLEARAPHPLPPAELVPLWFSLSALALRRALGSSALLDQSLDNAR